MQFTVANSGAKQRLSYLDIQGWKRVGTTNNPPFGPGPAVMFESPDGCQRAWFHDQQDRKLPDAPVKPSWPAEAVKIGIDASRAEGCPALAEMTKHLARTRGSSEGIDAMNQAWAFFERIDLGTSRRSNEVAALLQGDTTFEKPTGDPLP